MLKFFLKFHLVFKIFFQNSSLGIINVHQSLAKRLWGRERGLGESSKFSHPLGRELDGDWWGWWQLLMRKISKFLTHFIAQISWFTLENLVILNKRSKFWIFLAKIKKRLPVTGQTFQFFSFFWGGGGDPPIPATRENLAL